PVFTTNMGKGAVNEFHPLSFGVLGSLVGPTSLGRFTRSLVEDADLILQVGTRNNQNGTDSWRLIRPGTRIIQIDLDPQEIGRNYEAVRLVGDAAETLKALTQALKTQDLKARSQARPGLAERIADAWRQFETVRAPLLKQATAGIRP
ncbi:MAG: acetolactate synthase catalytic subunit, partial [Mesorhizobium sp.]